MMRPILSNWRGTGGATLSGGTWKVFAGSTLSLGSATITTNNANVQIDGAGSTWTALDSLKTNLGTLTISGARRFATAGALTNGGSVIIDASSVLRANGQLTNTGTIDVSSALVFDYTGASPLTSLAAQVRSGYAFGAWGGPGINSAAARSDSVHSTGLGLLEGSAYHAIFGPTATFAGESFDNSTLLIGYTYYGDTDLNGVVNFDDYARIDSGFNNGRTGWINGDFDYNGVINFDDYALIDLAFNTQSSGRLHSVPEVQGVGIVCGAVICGARRARIRRSTSSRSPA